MSDYDEAFFARGGMDALRDWLKNHSSPASRIPSTIRLGPPICRPSKIVCIGLNYRDHAAETGAAIPKEPVIFFKATTSVVGPNDALVIPRNATKVDWEVELALVVVKTALYVPKDVISTGTPAGVGLGTKPPQYLKSGDVVELGIEGLGESRQRVVNFSEQRYSKTV